MISSTRWFLVLRAVSCGAAAWLAAATAHATFTASPPAITLFPHQNATLGLTITFPPAAAAGTGTVAFSGFPAGAFAYQGSSFTVQFSWTAGATSSTTTFSIGSSSSVPPGTYTVTMSEAALQLGAGSGTLSLTIRYASMSASAAPNPLTLEAGGPARAVNVTTLPDPGLDTCIAYSFSGLPGFISTGSAPDTCEPTYPPVGFSFSATPSAAAGTYTGSLVANYLDNQGSPITRNFPFTVVVQRPDVLASFMQPSMTVCRGGPAVSNAIQLSSINGYAGTPSLSFTSIPTGLLITPSNPPAAAMPPGQSIPFTVTASPSLAPGSFTATLHVADAGVSKDIPLLVVVAAPDFTASAAPAVLPLSIGGASQALTATVLPNACFGETVAVAPSGAPAGISIVPASLSLSQPYGAQTFQVSAASGTAPGTYPLTLTFVSPGTTRTATVSLVVSSVADFVLTVNPAALNLTRASSATVTVSATGINGFAENVAVRAPSLAGVTFSPATFSIPAGGSQPVTVTASPTSAPGMFSAVFRGTSPGIAGERTATLALTVSAAVPPEITDVTPPATTPGALGLVLRLSGRNFQPGATVSTTSAQIRIEATTVLSSSLADVRISVGPDAQPGRFLLTIVNPDGGRSSDGAALLVYPRSSLGAPLGVTDAAIVFPAEGTLIATGDAVYPRALLATTGTGTIIASWTIDGGVFDRVTATVAAGEPAELGAHVPIPSLPPGDHRLALLIEIPRLDVSPSVRVVATLESSSGLVLLAPRADAVLDPSGTRFRWSLVPLSSGYEVLVRRPGILPPLRFRTARSEWVPSAADLAQISPGIHEWAVRPIFAGEVAGEPSPARRFALLPERVELTLLPASNDPQTGRAIVRWSGGIPGLLYRVDFLASDSAEPEFSALTPREEYGLPERSPFGASRYRVRVTAYGPDGRALGETASSPPRSALPDRGGMVLARRADPPNVQAIEPSEGSTVSVANPVVSARWDRAVPTGEVVLLLDATDVTAVSQVTATSIVYRPLLPLAPGPHEATLSLAGASGAWHFTVGPGAQTGATGPGAGGAAPGMMTDWGLTLLGTVVVIEGAAPQNPDTARLQASTRGDLATETLAAKFAGDVSVRRDLDPPEHTVQESRNWLVELGAGKTPYRQEARVGYASPRFLDGAELLTAGLARGGVEARLASPVINLSYYHSFDASPAGVTAGSFGPKQKVDALALETPWDPSRLLLRAIGLRAETEATAFSPGGKGDLVGLFGRWSAGPMLSVALEAAHGDFQPTTGPDREGWAFRLGLGGMFGTLQYAANVRYTDANFVNPANPGFTPGGIANRTGGDISLLKSFGLSSVGFQYRHIEGGTTSGSLTPSSREDGGNLTFQTLLTPRVILSASGNLTQDRGDADPALSLPAIDRQQYGASATATETLGAIGLSQTYSYQRVRDQVTPLANTTVQTATFSANGNLATGFTVSALVSGTRSAGSASVGRTDLLLLSIQPIVAIPAMWVSLQPRATYTQVKNSLVPARTHSEQYQAIVAICPPFMRTLFSLQLSGDWMRSRASGQPAPDFTSRYSGAVTIRWGAGKGPAAPPATILPGTMPFTPPQSGATGLPPGAPGTKPTVPGGKPW